MRRPGNSVGARVFTTASDLATLLEVVNKNFGETRAEFALAFSHKAITDAESSKFTLLYNDWESFYLDWTSRSFVFPWEANAAADLADAYDRDRAGYRTWLAQKDPTDTTGPEPTLATPPEQPKGIPWGLIAGSVAVVAAAYALGPLLRNLGSRAASPSPSKK